jgi:hypothetical protein
LTFWWLRSACSFTPFMPSCLAQASTSGGSTPPAPTSQRRRFSRLAGSAGDKTRTHHSRACHLGPSLLCGRCPAALPQRAGLNSKGLNGQTTRLRRGNACMSLQAPSRYRPTTLPMPYCPPTHCRHRPCLHPPRLPCSSVSFLKKKVLKKWQRRCTSVGRRSCSHLRAAAVRTRVLTLEQHVRE